MEEEEVVTPTPEEASVEEASETVEVTAEDSEEEVVV